MQGQTVVVGVGGWGGVGVGGVGGGKHAIFCGPLDWKLWKCARVPGSDRILVTSLVLGLFWP